MKSSWPKIPLGEVLKKSGQWISVQPNENYKQVTVRLWGKGVILRREVAGVNLAVSQMLQVEPNQFILSRIDARNGAFGLIPESLDGAVVSNDFPVFNIDLSRLLPGFLHWMSKTHDFVDFCRTASEGTTNRVRLKEDRFLSTAVPLPPLPEQRRIVVRIEELAAKIDEAHTLRQQAVEEVEALSCAYRNSLLGPAANDFRTSRLEELATRITKGESPEWQGYSYQEQGPFFIRSENVLWGNLDIRWAVHIPEAFHEKLSRSQVHEGDVLINLVGASIGRACSVPKGLEAANVNQAVAVISPQADRLLPDFLVHFLLSPVTQDTIHGGKVETARPNISLSDLRRLQVPLLSLDEQQCIVTELAALQTKVEALTRLQAETAAELDALLPSILHKAFNGEL